jgi:hypothetical protein
MSLLFPDVNAPFIELDGKLTQRSRTWANAVSRDVIISGNGNPEGAVEALPAARYMDTTGTAGNILYIKRDAQVGGDKKLGWILV